VARIAGVNIPTQKRVEVALTYIFGIGSSSSRKILDKAKVSQEARVKDGSEERRVGKECRSRGSQDDLKKKE